MKYGKNYGPGDLTPEALDVVKIALQSAMDVGHLKPKEARTALAILSVNPHRRLDRLGVRLERVKDLCKQFEDCDFRIKDIQKSLEDEHESLKRVIEAHPVWGEEAEGGS